MMLLARALDRAQIVRVKIRRHASTLLQLTGLSFCCLALLAQGNKLQLGKSRRAVACIAFHSSSPAPRGESFTTRRARDRVLCSWLLSFAAVAESANETMSRTRR